MSRLICQSCCGDYAVPGERRCQDCLPGQPGGRNTPPPPSPPTPADLAGTKLSDFT